MEIKLATINDISTIQDVANRTWFVTYEKLLSKEQLFFMFEMMYSNESLEKQFLDGQNFYIAYENGMAYGFVSVEKQSDEIFHLHKLYVDPLKQGTGLGRKLITRVFQHARKNSCTPENCYVELNVNRNNKALDFYKHVGMNVDRTVDIPIGEGFYMNDYIMKIKV